MNELLTPEGYESAKARFAGMQNRLAELEKKRSELRPWHFEAVRRSYLDMMRQYLRGIKLFEASLESCAPRDDLAGKPSGESSPKPQPEV